MSSTSLAPHQAAALQHCFGGNFKFAGDVQQRRDTGNVTGIVNRTCNVGPGINAASDTILGTEMRCGDRKDIRSLVPDQEYHVSRV